MTAFKRIDYDQINSRQKEIFNFQKVSGVLADYGYSTFRLSDDWNGADFIAVPFGGGEILRVQLKSRLAFAKKYRGKDLWVCFRHDGFVYLYPHDQVLDEVLKLKTTLEGTKSWEGDGGLYSFPTFPKDLQEMLAKYRLGHEGEALPRSSE